MQPDNTQPTQPVVTPTPIPAVDVTVPVESTTPPVVETPVAPATEVPVETPAPVENTQVTQ